MRAPLVTLISAAALAACGEARPPVAPAAALACGGSVGEASVTIGLGAVDFTELTPEAVAPQVFGAQGGSHVFVGARLRGFRSPVDLTFEARDAYSHARLGSGRLSSVASTGPDVPAGACDVRGVVLLLNALFPGGAGLADVSVLARDATGLTRSATQRAWIGRPLTACTPRPGEGSLVPLWFAGAAQRRDEALAIVPGTTLRPSAAAEVMLGAGVLGMAASSVALTARLFDDDGARGLLREVRAGAPTGDAAMVPTLRRADPECVAPVTLRLPVDPAMGGRPLRLSLTADDGLGHALTEDRVVRFITDPEDAGTAPTADVPDAAIAPDVPDAAIAPDVPDVPDVPVALDVPVAVDAPDAATAPRSGLTLLSEQSFGFGAHARELVLDGDTIYLADSNSLPVVSIDPGGATRLVHAISPMREQHCSTASMHARSRTLVCAAGDSGYLDLIDVRAPAAPRSRPWDLNAHAPPGPPIYEVADVEVVGDTAWLAAQRSGLLRLTLGDDGSASGLVRTGIGAEVVGVVSDGARLALIDRSLGLSLRSLPGLEELATAPLDGPPLDVALSSDRVAVALGGEGARVLRVAGGALAPWVSVQPRCVATAVALSADALAVACLTGVTVYDLRGSSPRVVGFYPARYGMLDVAFSPRGLVVADWYGLDLLAVDTSGVARVPDVPRAMRLRPGADARIGVRNPGPAPLDLAWRATPSAGTAFGGTLSLPADGDAVLAVPFARTGLSAGAAASLDVTFSAGGPAVARTHVAWRATTDEPARGLVAIGDRFPTLRRTVSSPYPATLPPPGVATRVLFLTVDCYLQWPQLEDMAWSRAHGATQPEPTILYLTTSDEDPFDPRMFMRSHAAAELPTFEWADYSRSVLGLESQTNFVRGFETSFMMLLPGADFPHDYVLAADGATVETAREYRGRWPLTR